MANVTLTLKLNPEMVESIIKGISEDLVNRVDAQDQMIKTLNRQIEELEQDVRDAEALVQ